jgi:hypothetical protein
VQAIMASASYREADQVVAFLDQPESHGVRLQIDYLKAELSLHCLGVENTIVVFGSTRIREPAAAPWSCSRAGTARSVVAPASG